MTARCFAFLWLLALSALAMGNLAQAQVSFDATVHSGPSSSPVVSGPLTFTTPGYHGVGNSASLSFISPITGDGNFLVYNSTIGVTESFAMSSGLPFNLLSLDLAGWLNFGPTAQTVAVTGLRADSSTVSINLSVVPGSFTHFVLAGFSNLTTVELLHGGASATYYVGVDNVLTSPVPEPEALSMLLGGLCLLGIWTRRSRSVRLDLATPRVRKLVLSA